MKVAANIPVPENHGLHDVVLLSLHQLLIPFVLVPPGANTPSLVRSRTTKVHLWTKYLSSQEKVYVVAAPPDRETDVGVGIVECGSTTLTCLVRFPVA